MGGMGGTNAGGTDAVVCKLDRSGHPIWIRQLGTAQNEEAFDLALGPAGELYVCGITGGALNGAGAGGDDAFIAKLDTAGATLWIRQFGSSASDRAPAVAVGTTGIVYAGGWTGGVMESRQYGGGDAFLTAFDAEGNRLWTRQFGTSNWDGAHGLAAFKDGSGDALVGGCWNYPNCGGWMRRYTSQGTLVWEKVLSKTPSQSSCGQTVSVDAGARCYHIGGTNDALFGDCLGSQDAFVARLSAPSGIDGRRTGAEIPAGFVLYQNAPNPFNPDTEIRYSVRRDSRVRIRVSDLLGRTVATLVDGEISKGEHTVRWNGTGDSGTPAGSGLYLCRMDAETGSVTRKMMLVR
jgi:hypothetical protein